MQTASVVMYCCKIVYLLRSLVFTELVHAVTGADLLNGSPVTFCRLQNVFCKQLRQYHKLKENVASSRRVAGALAKFDFRTLSLACLPPKRSPNVKIRHYHRKDRPILPPCTTRRARDGNIWVFFRSVAKSWLFWPKQPNLPIDLNTIFNEISIPSSRF